MSEKSYTIQNDKIYDSRGRCQGHVGKEMMPSCKWVTCPHCGDPVPKYSFHKHIKHCGYGIGFRMSKIDQATSARITTKRKVVKSSKKVANDKIFDGLFDLAASLDII